MFKIKLTEDLLLLHKVCNKKIYQQTGANISNILNPLWDEMMTSKTSLL